MSPLRQLAGPAYLVAAILILFPPFELLQEAWPVRLFDINWRVETVGTLSGMIVLPLFGFLLAFALALFLEQWRAVKLLAWFNVCLVVVLFLGLAVYGYDTIRLRGDLAREAHRAYDLQVVTAFAKYALGLLVLLALVYAERRAVGLVNRKVGFPSPAVDKAEPAPLLFHTEVHTQGSELPQTDER